MQGRFTFLGTGASAGIPVIGCSCSVCHSTSACNKRFRTSGLLEVHDKTILIDAGPDFRMQALKHRIEKLDALLLTHTHFDHIAGIDELRIFTFKQQMALPCILSKPSFEELKIRFYYLFKARLDGESWFVHVDFRPLEKERGDLKLLDIPIRYFSYFQGNMPVNGFRIGNFAYVTDIHKYPETIFEDLKGVEILVVSALREAPSFIHFNFEQAIHFAKRVDAKTIYLTHLSHEVDYETMHLKLPQNVKSAFDGLTINFEW